MREACLAGALTRREPWGVWGGELLANGKILANKRKRGRPPKVRPVETEVPAADDRLTARPPPSNWRSSVPPPGTVERFGSG